ncbi:MAG: hypothetical protein EON48_04885 [Acetobacteraceae bacterium]|nr:MAG: hypothetical protein EON48_04885 [Acetobacteraceae bacterium]
MTLHVLFTKDGTPAWVGPEPIDGSEAVEEMSVEFLAGHRRTSKGNWVARPVTTAVEPTAEELAARASADYRAALEARDQALRSALAEDADPLFFRWQRDEAGKDDWLAAVAAVKARFPKPEKP